LLSSGIGLIGQPVKVKKLYEQKLKEFELKKIRKLNEIK